MSMWYRLNGVITVRNSEVTRKLIQQLADKMGNGGCSVEWSDENVIVTFKYGDYRTWISVQRIEHMLHELGQHAYTPTRFETTYDDGSGHIWVGPSGLVATIGYSESRVDTRSDTLALTIGFKG